MSERLAEIRARWDDIAYRYERPLQFQAFTGAEGGIPGLIMTLFESERHAREDIPWLLAEIARLSALAASQGVAPATEGPSA